MTSKTTYLYLVRHGATDANLKRPYILQGSSIDMSLNDTGRAQAEAVSKFLEAMPLSAVYSSRMKRAFETGQAIAVRHRIEAHALDNLHECDVGQWEGMAWETIMSEHPDEYRAFMDDPDKNPYLGGESYGNVLTRTHPVIEGLFERHQGQSIAVVAHNVVNRVYLANLLGLDLRKAKDLQQKNACVNVIRYKNGQTNLMTLNSFFHLDESLR